LSAAPPVSVLVPARDAAATVGAALATVFAQDFESFEVVVVDDGSVDGTRDVLARFPGRLRVIEGVGEGIVGALNRGLAACRGAFIARFDADDLMHRHRLSRQVALLADASLAGAGSLVRCFPRPPLRDGLRRYEAWLNTLVTPDDIARERFVEAPLVHPSVTVRADVLRALGGWRDVPWPEDWDLWLRAIERGHRFAKVPEVLHFWRDGATRLTRTGVRYSAEALVRARAHFLARGPLAGREACVWGAGPVGKALVKALDAEGARVIAYVDVDPRKIGQRVHGRPVLGAKDLPEARENGPILLAAVGAKGARDDIRRAATAGRYVEGVDFFACA
jgi:glycosyltransferase involved in cell wall biosynthesis